MAKTYEELQTEIARLQAEAEALRQQEVAEVITKIRHAIDHYGLSAADLGFGRGKAARKAVAPKSGKPASRSAAAKPARKKPGRPSTNKAAAAAAALYRDEEGRTWGGRGKRPRWLHDALAAGRRLEDFRVPQD